MLDLRLIREEPERVKAAVATTFTEAPIDEILALDMRRRSLLTEVEALKAELNAGSKQVGRTKDAAERETLIARMRGLGDRIAALDEEVAGVDTQLHGLMLRVLNLPLPHVPVAPDDRRAISTSAAARRCERDRTTPSRRSAASSSRSSRSSSFTTTVPPTASSTPSTTTAPSNVRDACRCARSRSRRASSSAASASTRWHQYATSRTASP